MDAENRIFKTIETVLARKMAQLDHLRKLLDLADSNNAHAQVELQQQITRVVIEIEQIERLYRLLRGET